MAVNSNTAAAAAAERRAAAAAQGPRIRIEQAGGQTVGVGSVGQQPVQSGATEVQQDYFGQQQGYGGGGEAVQVQSSASMPTFVEQAAAQDMGSLAQQNGRQAEQEATGMSPQTGQQQQRSQFASMAGLAPQQAAPTPQDNGYVRPNVPLVDMSSAGDLGIMSSRRDAYSEEGRQRVIEGLADSGADLIASRMAGNGPLAPVATPSRMAMEDMEEAGQRRATEARKPEVEMYSPIKVEATDDTVHGRPDSVFNRPFGYRDNDRSARTKSPSMKRPTTMIKALKDRFARAFKRNGVGVRVYGKMLANTSLDFREIGLGLQDIIAAVNQDPTMVNRLFSAAAGEEVDVSTWASSNDIVDFLKTHEVYVGTFKPPNNRGQDVQRRRLRVLTDQQRGIYLHPVMAAMYTADFDGDDMEVSFDPDVAELARDPMDYMVGIDGKYSLNVDFLPVAEIVGGYEEGKTDRDFVREVILSSVSRADGRTVRPLVDAIIDLGKTWDKDGDAQAAAWGDVFMEARRLSDAVSGSKAQSDRTMSLICKSVFDNMQVIKVRNALSSVDATIVDMENMPEPRSYDDSAIYKIVEGMVEGKVPNNFQELKAMLTGFMGNVAKKNAPFRFTADVGKMMKMDSRFLVGDEFVYDPNNNEHMRAFFESTVKFAASVRMAKQIKKAGRSKYYTQLMREQVINEVGFPESYGTYAEFLDRFVSSYSKWSAVINEANLVFLSNMGIASDSNRGLVSPLNPSKGGVTISDLAEPMLSVYGNYSVGRMFQSLSTPGIMGDKVDTVWGGNPNAPKYSQKRAYEREYDNFLSKGFWITGKYLNWSLRKFKNENRLVRGDAGIEEIRDTRVSEAAKMNDVEAQTYMLMAIADKRTGTASTFCESVYGKMGVRNSSGKVTTVKMLSDLLVELNRLDTDGTVSGRRDQMLWVNDVVNTLIMSGPDMFTHFNMDSAVGFLQSDWAKKMIEHANDVEVLGGIRTAMVFDYRMERVSELMSETLPDPNEDPNAYMDAMNNIKFAKDELSAASEVWSGIIKEFDAEATEGMDSVFSMLTSKGFLNQRNSYTGKQYGWTSLKQADGEIRLEALKFWRDPGEHKTLRSVIEDLDMDRDTKWKVITDVVRYWENDAYLKSYEVGFQLEVGNDSSYSLGSAATQGALDVYRDFEKSFNRWGKMSQQKLQEEVDDAYEMHGKDPESKGKLMTTLQRLDECPWELISIDDGMYADSILSVLDKNYSQTEKSSQHPWTNAIYSAVSFQRNGGYQNDIYRTDDRVLGIQSVDSVGIQDVIHILADPDAELWVYNEYGEYGMVTRDIVLQNALGREVNQNDIESDIWEFLQMEPRIASSVRQHAACVMANTEGKGFVGSMLSIEETIERANDSSYSPVAHVKYLMRDHPVYAAIISLANPATGAVTRNARERIRQTEDYLAGQIYSYASSRDADSVTAATEILADMGITRDSLVEALRSDYDKFLEGVGLPTAQSEGGYDNGELEEDAVTTYSTAVEYMTKYINEVRTNVRPGQHFEMAERPSWLGVDTASAASFWDVTQELGGSKTGVSTGIEGSETYQFAEWASHVMAKDKYADLEAVFDDVIPEWNGLPTTLRNPDGSFMTLEVDEDGSIANYRQLMRAKRDQGMSEVVTSVPEGYDVPDRSTDSHDTPVSSFFAYMVSKRSNGAEAFNLKAKKAGLDGKDSITKMNGKYRMVDNGQGASRANFFDIQFDLQQTAQQNGENGLTAARMQLAMILMQENNDLGYDDLTLANYMSIADLMLIQGDDGQVHLRSLEMLMAAIKNRLGASVDEMKDPELIKRVNDIVSDTSENGVGIAMMSSIEAFDKITPKSKAFSFNGMRTTSSVFERNYDLLSSIMEDAKKDGVAPFSQSKAEQLNGRTFGQPGMKDMIKKLETTRGYNFVGYAGAADGSERIEWTVGASNAVIIGAGNVSDAKVAEICDKAYKYGMTVVVNERHQEKIPGKYRSDAMPCSDKGDVLIPCFDMRLNGAESSPYNGGQFAVFQAPFTRYVVSVEDSINEHMLGDAQAKATRALVDRVKIVDNGSKTVTADELFPNVFRNPQFRHSSFTVALASGKEIENLIAGAKARNEGVSCTIDYGIVEGGNGFEQRVHDVNQAIERYQARWSEANADGLMMMEDCHPGDIVGWAICEIQDQFDENPPQYVLSPIIPFPLHGPKNGVPEKFTVQQLGYADGDGTVFSVDWTNTTEMGEGGYVKYFDSSGGANKGMVSLADVLDDPQLVLRDGTSVDMYVAKASTDSRKIGTDRRIKTMISLMALSRMHGYNFAKSEGAFPSDPSHPENDEIRERMLGERIPTTEWKGWLREGRQMLFTHDQRLNAFLNYECRKVLRNGGNPYDYLANVYADPDGAEHNTHVMWEFEAMFEQGLNYEDGLLRFLHAMDPTFCPNGVNDMGDYLFRLWRDADGEAKGYDQGVLQMQVPHRRSDGKMAYLWDNVYVGMSFFGEEYSGFSRPNIDGASNFLDAMNTMSYYGTQLDERSARFRAMWATADFGRVPRDGGAIGKA